MSSYISSKYLTFTFKWLLRNDCKVLVLLIMEKISIIVQRLKGISLIILRKVSFLLKIIETSSPPLLKLQQNGKTEV